MRAFNAIAHLAYILAIVGVAGFLVAGVVPDSLEELPFDIEIGADCEYPVSDSKDTLRENLRSAAQSNEGTLTIIKKGPPPVFISYINSEDTAFETQLNTAVDLIDGYKSTDPEARVIVVDIDEKIVKQEMRMMDSDEMSFHFYTEVTITNKLRYALKDINVGLDILNDDNSVNYRILKSVPTTIESGKKASIPIEFEVNMLNAVLVMMSGSEDSLDIYLGIDLSGKYYFGLAGASIYATAKFSTAGELPSITMDVTETRVEVKLGEKLEDSFLDLPDDPIEVTIGDVTITIENDDVNGFSVVVDTGSFKTIVDALKEQYENGDYSITVEIGGTTETYDMDEEQFAQMIEIVEAIMEALT